MSQVSCMRRTRVSIVPNAPIQPVDGILQSAALHRPAGGTFGFTLGKRNADRWRTDLSVDVFVEPLMFTPAAKAGIEGASILRVGVRVGVSYFQSAGDGDDDRGGAVPDGRRR